MRRNMMWLLVGMALMGGARAIAECLTDHMPVEPIGMPGCVPAAGIPLKGAIITTMPPTFEPARSP